MIMSNAKSQAPTIPLPRTWPESVKSAVLHVVAPAQFAAARTRGWAANSINAPVRLKAENDRLQLQIQLLREEIRIKDSRMKQVPASRRPHYPPVQRMAILELKAARCWSLEQIAKTFLVTAATVAS
jgi:predicted RNA polymerase sigma factor